MRQIIFSIIFIVLLHHIYTFFINNLTTPKVKDLINKPKRQYDDIYKNIVESRENKEQKGEQMKSELKEYLSKISKKKEKVEEIKTEGSQIIFSNAFESNFQTL